ncbi:unnamed protein product [Tilletia caries]|uniref:DDE-1 domain-containing protein n=1 Tax=Tilletia caries TaxID=13290 RepID=A0ABN7IUG4_9BASI|nr:unnamed protein product [Tilletia caries]
MHCGCDTTKPFLEQTVRTSSRTTTRLGEKKILTRIKKSATRIRNELKPLIRSSQKESLDSAAANIREFAGTVAGKWGVDVSYDLIVRLAWLRKMGKEKVPIDEAGPDWWDNIQEELDIIVDMNGDCDTLDKATRPLEEIAFAEHFEHADEEWLDQDEIDE